MAAPHLPFIDWMKCLGISAIVFGHVVNSPLNLMTAPIYPKQLGVAIFVFVAGYSLALERRGTARVVLNRLFELLLVGGLCAVAISAIRLSLGLRPDPSNYLPLLLGANVLFDNLPANPTTWYIGTYIHLVLLWAFLLRGVVVRPTILVGVFAVEMVVRAAVWSAGTEFVAYMFVTNWLGLFLLGQFCGQRAASDPHWRPPAVGYIFVVLAGVWLVAAPDLWSFDEDFPFRAPSGDPAPRAAALAIAAGVSVLYYGVTWLAYRVTSALPSLGVVRFVAANTIFIFVIHMPLYFYLLPRVRGLLRPGERSALLFLVCLFGLAAVGEAFRRLVPVAALRERLAQRLAIPAGPVQFRPPSHPTPLAGSD